MPESLHPVGVSPQVHLTPLLLEEITRIGLDRQPAEACGVLLLHPRYPDDAKSQVVELPNRSMHTHDSYQFSMRDLWLELEDWWGSHSREEASAISVWHTHPGGLIGPSPGDMKSRREGIAYLVVAMTESGPVPTWF